MRRNKLTIGLFGFGCVGTGLYEVLKKTPALQSNIKKICIKDSKKPRSADSALFTSVAEDLLEDPEITVIVELIDDAEAAYKIVTSALKAGKAVVSANKKMIATHLPELLELQQRYQVPLLYEAACCASIPVIRNLEEYYDNDLLKSIEGIVNGSTNYILTTTEKENCSYETALQRAQELGYAETDPRLDTQGYDAKYKLVLLLAHAFGLTVEPGKIFNLGIDRIQKSQLDYAREKNLKIKLVAYACRNSEERIEAFVLPSFIESADRLYEVDDVFNGVKINSSLADTQFFSGKGAGSIPTATAIISDLSALSYGYKYEYKKLGLGLALENDQDILLKVMISSEAALKPAIQSAFLLIQESLLKANTNYYIGAISLAKLKRLVAADSTLSVILLHSYSVYEREQLIAEYAGTELIC